MAQEPAGFVPDGFVPDGAGRGNHPEARISAAIPGSAMAMDPLVFGKGTKANEAEISQFLSELKDDPSAAMQRVGSAMKKSAQDPKVWLSLAAAYFAPKVLSAAAPIIARAARGAMSVAGQAVDVADADLVSIASPRIGAALKKAQQVKDALAARGAPAAEPPIAAPVEASQAAESSLELTRRLKAEWLEQHGGLDAARQAITPPDAVTPATSPAPTPPPASPATAPAPSVAPAGAASSASLKDLMASGLTPKEANAALKLLRQGMDPEAVQAQILAARPSPASVAPPAAAPPVESAAPPAAPAVTQSPIQKMTNIRPGVPAAPAQVQSAIGLAARRAGVTLAKEDVGLLTRAIEAGMAPETAVQQLPALKLQQMPGVLTPEQVNAEIAARGPGNRSPKR